MERKSALGSLLDFHRARLIALDNWNLVQQVMASESYPVHAIVRALGVTELGAHSVIAMLRGSIPDRTEIENRLWELERIRLRAADHAALRGITLARSGARHMLE